ncbi:MAG: MEDS domain-containing protein [Candidatus Methanoperedens sp.]
MRGLRKEVSMGFTGDLFLEGTHMCLIYDNEEQRRKIIGQFLASGISSGEKVGYFADTTKPEELITWLKDIGMEIQEMREEGLFNISRAESIYCPTGKFVPSEMLARLGSYYDQAINAGYTGARASGEMSWALKGIPGSDRLMEYEALINIISEQHPVTPICQYDARRFDGATLLNVLKVHPMMIVQGQIVQNPYYMLPQDFLEEFKTAE